MNLPPELLVQIFSLTPSSLPRLANSHPVFSTIVGPILYQNIIISTPNAALSLAYTFSPNGLQKQLGEYVESIEIRGRIWEKVKVELGEIVIKCPGLKKLSTSAPPESAKFFELVRKNCPLIEELEISITYRRPNELENYLDQLFGFSNLKCFSLRVEDDSGWTLYELPSQLCEMLYRSPSLRKLSISSLQGRGWSLDVSPLILSPSARFPSLESLIFFGSTCTLGTRGNFEQEEREMIKFLLNLKVGELGLGGSIARRQFEFGILDGLELGEREVMFPNIISYHGTSSNASWIGKNRALRSISILPKEPLDLREFSNLLNSISTNLRILKISFALYDHTRPTIEFVLQRISLVCPGLEEFSISTVDSLRYPSRSIYRSPPIVSSFNEIIISLLGLTRLKRLSLPPGIVCGLAEGGDLEKEMTRMMREIKSLWYVYIDADGRDGYRAATESSNWERRVRPNGTVYAHRV